MAMFIRQPLCVLHNNPKTPVDNTWAEYRKYWLSTASVKCLRA